MMSNSWSILIFLCPVFLSVRWSLSLSLSCFTQAAPLRSIVLVLINLFKSRNDLILIIKSVELFSSLIYLNSAISVCRKVENPWHPLFISFHLISSNYQLAIIKFFLSLLQSCLHHFHRSYNSKSSDIYCCIDVRMLLLQKFIASSSLFIEFRSIYSYTNSSLHSNFASKYHLVASAKASKTL
jgi:hypothetical protein